MYKFTTSIITLATALTLTACGGGSDPATDSSSTTNSFSAMVGTYSSGCVDTTKNGSNGQSESWTLTLTTPSGTSSVAVSGRSKIYRGSATCQDANLFGDISVNGLLTALTTTKSITGNSRYPKSGTASTATFRLDGFQLTQGSLTIPGLGTTTTVGYLLEGNKLYAVMGVQDSDGLGSNFSNLSLTKQ